ncbi:hypothetical protein P153DRAFT_371191 [Dothidotthia symphoricarpi CBS 119687]|uniref:Uncharacterized protein n=1 Tax=Dothidotthia symphoricarpi CBS 119687 TaxID=1392245 RepID=A0A6A5ZYA7_9PLEO|nr:uncharacterized protein P153DRAFT_371191 [Dothidotthia symphoricarpi CBS 119687]KAF2123863.1 hypothetical protein P153DRAFT_371191 [Dothidotthia symphoricarpi CBS 119687]
MTPLEIDVASTSSALHHSSSQQPPTKSPPREASTPTTQSNKAPHSAQHSNPIPHKTKAQARRRNRADSMGTPSVNNHTNSTNFATTYSGIQHQV